MWRFCDRLKTALGVALLAHAVFAVASTTDAQGVENQTTTGRTLIKAALPAYPREEVGRWTQSCVSLYFTVRKDGKTDQFVVLEATRPSAKAGNQKRALDANAPDDRAFDDMPETDKKQEAQAMWRFVEPSMKALYSWQYASGKPGDEIAVFLFERSGIGGHLMKISARRLDLETKNPVGCAAIDPDKVRQSVATARAKKS